MPKYSTGQKVGLALGAAALGGIAAYGAYNHYQNKKAVSSYLHPYEPEIEMEPIGRIDHDNAIQLSAIVVGAPQHTDQQLMAMNPQQFMSRRHLATGGPAMPGRSESARTFNGAGNILRQFDNIHLGMTERGLPFRNGQPLQ